MRSLALSLLLLGLPAPVFAQSESLRVSAGDMLSVQVFREPDLDAHVRVSDRGMITLPLLGAVAVAGLSAQDAGAGIAAAYLSRHFLEDPQVSVLIEQSASAEVAVLGEVGKPGVVALPSPRSLLDVLAEAGGLLRTADRHITVRHPGAAPATVLVTNSVEGQLRAASLLIAPGDTVLVPRAGIVYVLGDVGRPGGYLMQDDAHLSLLQALSLAAGSNHTAAIGHARLIRKVNGAPVAMPLQLKAMEQGSVPDMPLENDDIVYIPFSLARNFAIGTPSIAASASSALVYAAW